MKGIRVNAGLSRAELPRGAALTDSNRQRMADVAQTRAWWAGRQLTCSSTAPKTGLTLVNGRYRGRP